MPEFTERNEKFMVDALRLANYSLRNGETPVACVFVRNGEVISCGFNNTNDSLSGIEHAEFKGIQSIIDRLKAQSDYDTSTTLKNIFKEIDLYVTVEPCVMCASALKQIGIRKVYFGCGNERFGGNGSVLKVNTDSTTVQNNYTAIPGIYRKESILLLREFYTQENVKAPLPKSKKNRNLNVDTFPQLNWSNYLTQQEFIDTFGINAIEKFKKNLDLRDEINFELVNSTSIDISDILEKCEKPICLTRKRKIES